MTTGKRPDSLTSGNVAAMKWKLVKSATDQEPEIDQWDEDEDLSLGFSYLRALAERDPSFVELAPGVWWQSWLTSGSEGNSGPGWVPK